MPAWVMSENQRRCLRSVQFAMWQHQGLSLPSPTASSFCLELKCSAWHCLYQLLLSRNAILLQDLLSVAFNRIVLMDLHSGDVIQTWRYQNMKAWSVNWENKQVQILLEGNEKIVFQCLTADCKVVHEYIGGYIFLSMRSGDRNQSLNEEMFHKLTGGWHWSVNT